MPLTEDLTADVQEADAKLVTLSDRIALIDETVSNKKRMCMLQQHAALTNYIKITGSLIGVEQQEQP